MTNQEAIKEFESELKWAELKKYPYVSKQKIEADKMAIKALEQMPTTTSTDEPMTVIYPTIFCDDAVSREAVLKIIDGWYDNNREVENIEDLIILITYMQAVQPKRQTCKECMFWQDHNNGYPHDECCWRQDETPDADDYCSGFADMRGAE